MGHGSLIYKLMKPYLVTHEENEVGFVLRRGSALYKEEKSWWWWGYTL